jgi:Ferredoxin-like domain in Api92-like protein
VPYPSGWRKARDFRPRQWCITHWGVETDLGYHQTLVYDARAWEATYEFTTPDGAPVAWLAAVAAHYPTLRFALSWERPSDGESGTAHYRRGTETDAVGFHRIVGLPSRVPEGNLGAVAF